MLRNRDMRARNAVIFLEQELHRVPDRSQINPKMCFVFFVLLCFARFCFVLLGFVLFSLVLFCFVMSFTCDSPSREKS